MSNKPSENVFPRLPSPIPNTHTNSLSRGQDLFQSSNAISVETPGLHFPGHQGHSTTTRVPIGVHRECWSQNWSCVVLVWLGGGGRREQKGRLIGSGAKNISPPPMKSRSSVTADSKTGLNKQPASAHLFSHFISNCVRSGSCHPKFTTSLESKKINIFIMYKRGGGGEGHVSSLGGRREVVKKKSTLCDKCISQ